MARNHVNCRECGSIHKNPASSSLCVPCGKLTAKFNQKLIYHEKRVVSLTNQLEKANARIAELEEPERKRCALLGFDKWCEYQEQLRKG